MAQLTGDATGGRSMMNMISGGVGYIIMGSVQMISIMKQLARENTIKSAIQSLTQGGNVGSAQKLQQILTDAQVKNTEISCVRLSLEDYNRFTREASFRGFIYAGTCDMNCGVVVIPAYRAADFNSIKNDLKLGILEQSTSHRDVDKAVEEAVAVDVSEDPTYAKYARQGDVRSDPVPVDQYDFGKAPKGKLFIYDLDENGMPKPGSGNPMTGKGFAKGDVFFRNGKIDAKTGKFVGGIRYRYDGEKFVKGTAMPFDDPGVLKDTIKFYNPDEYAGLISLKGDAFRKAWSKLISTNNNTNAFSGTSKVGQSDESLRDIIMNGTGLLTPDASAFRSLTKSSITESDIFIAITKDPRNVVYVPWDRFSNIKPFSKNNKVTVVNFDTNNKERISSIEKAIKQMVLSEPQMYKMLPSDMASDPGLIETAVTSSRENWQHLPDSVLSSLKRVNQKSPLVSEYKKLVENYITRNPSKDDYISLDDEGLPRPNVAFIKDIPDEFLKLFTKDDLMKIAVARAEIFDKDIQTKPSECLFAPAKTSYAEEVKAAIEEIYSTRLTAETVITKQRFAKPKSVRRAKNPKTKTEFEFGEKVKNAGFEK